MKRLALSLVVGAATTFVLTPSASAQEQRVVHQPSARTPFSAAVQVGDTYWLSGKLGATDETRSMEEGRVAAETHNIMRAFGELLEELGMDFGDLVRGTVYLADIDGYAEMNDAYAQYFEPGNAPSRVTVAVGGLVAGAAIEISFIAVKSD